MPNLPEEGAYTMLAVGFAAGPKADAVSALKPEEALRQALSQLDEMFRGRRWLEGGGCSGKGDWEGQEVQAEAEAEEQRGPEESDLKSRQRGGVCGMAGAGGVRVTTTDKAEAEELPSEAYSGGLVHDWIRDEPYVRGGYSYPRFGFDENTHANAAASVNGSLFFAGEHTNTPTGMTVHAAINSGERWGVSVLSSWKQQQPYSRRVKILSR